MNSRESQRGFTLIELLIVLVIVGVLAAIAVPRYRSITDKSKVSTAVAELSHAMQGIFFYQVENDSLSYPTSAIIPGYEELRTLVRPYVGLLPSIENSHFSLVSYTGADTSFTIVVKAKDSGRTTLTGTPNGISYAP